VDTGAPSQGLLYGVKFVATPSSTPCELMYLADTDIVTPPLCTRLKWKDIYPRGAGGREVASELEEAVGEVSTTSANISGFQALGGVTSPEFTQNRS
jgi:hypothetical protein